MAPCLPAELWQTWLPPPQPLPLTSSHQPQAEPELRQPGPGPGRELCGQVWPGTGLQASFLLAEPWPVERLGTVLGAPWEPRAAGDSGWTRNPGTVCTGVFTNLELICVTAIPQLAKEWVLLGWARSPEYPGCGTNAVCPLQGHPLPSSAHGQGGHSPRLCLSALVTGIQCRLGVISERGLHAVWGSGRSGRATLGRASAAGRPCRLASPAQSSQGCSPRRRALAAALPSAPRRPGLGPGLAEKTTPEASPPRRPA